jgi:hypothetical protein
MYWNFKYLLMVLIVNLIFPISTSYASMDDLDDNSSIEEIEFEMQKAVDKIREGLGGAGNRYSRLGREST